MTQTIHTPLEEILNSEKFIAGVEECVSTTQRTRYETMFSLYKNICEDKIIYPLGIQIGDLDCVGGISGHKRALTKYLLEKNGSKKIDMDDFKIFLKENDEEYYRDIEEFNGSIINPEKEHALITFHTHPGQDLIYPSELDISTLRTDTKFYQEQNMDIKPISIIAGVSQFTNFFPLLFFQESYNIADDEQKIKIAHSWIYENFNNWINNNCVLDEPEKNPHFHKVALGYYHRKKDRVMLNPFFDYEMFGFNLNENKEVA